MLNINPIIMKQLHKSKLKDILQNNWPGPFKNVNEQKTKREKKKKMLRNYSRLNSTNSN